MKRASVEGIVEGMHASPLVDDVTGGATGGGAGFVGATGGGAGFVGATGGGAGFVGATGGGAGFVGAVVDVGAVAESLEALLDPQPLIAETKNNNVSGANAESALDLHPIATCSYNL